VRSIPRRQRRIPRPRGLRLAPLKRGTGPRGLVRLPGLAERPSPPPDWPGTYPEWLVAKYLEELGLPYEYVPKVAFGEYPGGIEADFVVYLAGEKLAIMVNGDYWHGHLDRDVRDVLKLRVLEAQGFRVVVIWESALLKYGREVVEAALRGYEYGRA
jgi:G:T-mismatch repair DNA endonuclease (very short patch repair protein)